MPPANGLPAITITVNPNGSVNVNGPLRDKGLCMRMLCQAIVAVAEYQEPAILRAETVPTVRRMRG